MGGDRPQHAYRWEELPCDAELFLVLQVEYAVRREFRNACVELEQQELKLSEVTGKFG